MHWLESLVTYLGDVVSPLRCAACDEKLQHRTLLCSSCVISVSRWNRDGYPIAFGYYGGALASILLRLKYGHRPDLGRPLGQLLQDVVGERLGRDDVDIIVPVPIPYTRLVERGYNQSVLIAQPLSRSLGVGIKPRVLLRRDGSVKQASLNRRERLENLRGAFLLRQPKAVENQRILLVDDVTTTGATLDTCRDVLMKGGATMVYTAVVAKTESEIID